MGDWIYIDPHFLDLGTNWRWVVSFTSLPLYPRRKSPGYLMDRRLGGPQSRSGRRGEEKFLDPTGPYTPYTDCAIPAHQISCKYNELTVADDIQRVVQQLGGRELSSHYRNKFACSKCYAWTRIRVDSLERSQQWRKKWDWKLVEAGLSKVQVH
jgi:hypothetical protein